jgi:hypothetical protein
MMVQGSAYFTALDKIWYKMPSSIRKSVQRSAQMGGPEISTLIIFLSSVGWKGRIKLVKYSWKDKETSFEGLSLSVLQSI